MRGRAKRWGLFLIVALACPTGIGQAEKCEVREPTLEAEPLGERIGRWQLLDGDRFEVTVTAPGAQRVRFYFQPLDVIGRRLDLGSRDVPEDGEVEAAWRAGPDLAGDFWAEVLYPDGEERRTPALALAHPEAVTHEAGEVPIDHVGGSVSSSESAFADEITGGEVEDAELVPGDPRVWISIDVPAFRLTLWQDGKRVRTYAIGIGRKDFPLPIGPRKATEIVWNPEWIPPNTGWVTAKSNVSPGERITAADPRNPLGKIKIRLGDAVLIHEAAKPTDIGRLVSHGCVRMLTQDLYDLVERIVAARALPVSPEQIEKAKATTRRLAIELEPPVWVDVDYDTEVVMAGELHLYPDVYGRVRDSLGRLHADLAESGISPGVVDAAMLRGMQARVSHTQEFVVRLDDLEAGGAVNAGRVEPLTDCSLDGPAA